MLFEKSETRTKRPLELVHSDVCGPVETQTWDDKKYILTMLDDYTHFTVIYLLQNKYEAADTIKEYVKYAEARWNTKLARLRCDNGREHANKNLQNWCKGNGIQMDFTVPSYTPQLNRKAERLNRTLLEKTRALLTESRLKKEMWGEVAYTATYLLNRSPTKLLKVTPYEMWNKKKPNLNSLKIFGCAAHVKILGPLRKLDNRSRKLTFVGYSPKGYRLWDAERRKIVVSRVKFKEKPEIVKERDNKNIFIGLDNKEDMQEDQNKEKENVQEELRNENEEEIEIDQSEEEQSEEYEDAEEENDAEQIQQLRRSTQTTKFPQKYNDYMFLTYQEATTGAEKEEWKEAIKIEKNSLRKNNTWKVVDNSEAEGKKILSCKWIFKTKDKGKKKARLVVKGFQQVQGIDYEETFSPVVNNVSLRILFALAVKKNYSLITFDIKTAFLYGNLDEDVYMYPPEG